MSEQAKAWLSWLATADPLITRKAGNITHSRRGYSIHWGLARYTDVMFFDCTRSESEVLAMAKARRMLGEQ